MSVLHPSAVGSSVVLATVMSAGSGCGPSTGTEQGEGSTSLSTNGTSSSGADETGSDASGPRPFRDEWRVVADQDFVHVGPDGAPQIFTLTIGGQQVNDNFANRGDIIVSFDGPEDRILIELRRFTFSTSQALADADFDDLYLWAFADSQPARPQDLDPEDDCVTSGWRNDCEIRVAYDDLSQLQRSGADIRVTLPPGYRQDITIITEDNDADPDYFNRGNVCVDNLFAHANIETDSGNVWVSLSPDVSPAPQCTPAQIEACETWTDAMGNAAPWAPECDCIAVGGGQFGLLRVENRNNAASDITVDLPAELWASMTAQNAGMGQNAAGDHCEAQVTIPGAVQDSTGNDFPWQAKYFANYPGPPAIQGAGFNIQATSSECSPVAFTEHPEQFVGVGNGGTQSVSERGNIEICSGCIVQSCNALIP
ncbi:MAG: hypothetical protein AAGF11_17200 [Myxococcota bacterium]